MKKMVIALVGVAALACLTGAAAVRAAPPVLGRMMAGACPADRPLGRLIMGQIGRLLVLHSEMNVTPEQKAQIRAVIQSHKPEITDAVKALVAAKRNLREQVTVDKPDNKAIQAASDRQGEASTKRAVTDASARFVKGSLQRVQFVCSYQRPEPCCAEPSLSAAEGTMPPRV